MNKKYKKIINIFVLFLLVAITASCNRIPTPNPVETAPTPSPVKTTPTASPVKTVPTPTSSSNFVENLLAGMTIEEKVGQIFIMSFRSLYNDDNPPDLFTKKDMNMIQNLHPGGIILFTENLKNIDQTSSMIQGANTTSKIPLFMGIDEEGGSISRLNSVPAFHSTVLPTKKEVGSTNTPLLAEKEGKLIGEEISSLGFNIDFAPVADVNTNPNNPVIGDRSFGSDPGLVARMVAAEVKGMHEANVITVAKHFPGHGDTSQDTHTGAVTLEHDINRLRKVEFVPFIKSIEAGTDCIMVAHIKVPKVTGNDIPASLSKKMITGILRSEMNFDGLVITDALDMAAITDSWSSEAAAVMAFEAGADILLMPASPENAYQGVLNAVKSGRITKQRIDESVRRILTAKYKYGILTSKGSILDPEKILGSQEHQNIAKEIQSKVNAVGK